jgi:hypothetical protein
MRPVATATLCVTAFAPTSTMWAWPCASKCVKGEFWLGIEFDMVREIKTGKNHLHTVD